MDDHTPWDESDGLAARLRAADPSTGVEPDLPRLRARVDEGTGTGRVLPLPRQRRPLLTSGLLRVAAVMTGVLVVGSSGFALGQNGLGGVGGAESSVMGPAADSAGGQAAPEGTESARQAGPEQSAPGSAVDLLYPAPASRATFRSTGLSTSPGSAGAWGFAARSAFSKDAAARTAQALGVEGTPELVEGSWSIGPRDGSGPLVQLQPDGTASLGFYDPALELAGCVAPVPAPAGEPSEGGTTGTPSGSVPAKCPVGPPGGGTGAEEARERVAELLLSLGVGEAELVVEGGPGSTLVTAHLLVSGERSGAVWSVALVGDGVQHAHGPLAPLVALGQYDVVSEVEAVQRLSDPRFGTGGLAVPTKGGAAQNRQSAPSPEEPVDSGPLPVPVVPEDPVAGMTVPWAVEDVEITAADLTTALHTLPDGRALLLPTYQLSSTDGRTWSVLALSEGELDLTPRG